MNRNCGACGTLYTVTPGGGRSYFCSKRCANAAAWERKRQLNGRMPRTCAICEGPIPRGRGGKKPRKYCSTRCNNRARYDRLSGEDMGLRGRQLDLTSPPRIMNEPTARQRAAMEADGVDPASFGRW